MYQSNGSVYRVSALGQSVRVSGECPVEEKEADQNKPRTELGQRTLKEKRIKRRRTRVGFEVEGKINGALNRH